VSECACECQCERASGPLLYEPLFYEPYLFQRAVGRALLVVAPLSVRLQFGHVFFAFHNHVHVEICPTERFAVVPLFVLVRRRQSFRDVFGAKLGNFFPAVPVKHPEQRYLALLGVIDVEVDDMRVLHVRAPTLHGTHAVREASVAAALGLFVRDRRRQIRAHGRGRGRGSSWSLVSSYPARRGFVRRSCQREKRGSVAFAPLACHFSLVASRSHRSRPSCGNSEEREKRAARFVTPQGTIEREKQKRPARRHERLQPAASHRGTWLESSNRLTDDKRRHRTRNQGANSQSSHRVNFSRQGLGWWERASRRVSPIYEHRSTYLYVEGDGGRTRWKEEELSCQRSIRHEMLEDAGLCACLRLSSCLLTVCF